MEHVGISNGYNVHRNSEGFLEGYRTSGVIDITKGGFVLAKNCDRVVTTARTLEEFYTQVERKHQKRKRQKKYDPYKDKNQMQLKL